MMTMAKTFKCGCDDDERWWFLANSVEWEGGILGIFGPGALLSSCTANLLQYKLHYTDMYWHVITLLCAPWTVLKCDPMSAGCSEQHLHSAVYELVCTWVRCNTEGGVAKSFLMDHDKTFHLKVLELWWKRPPTPTGQITFLISPL